MTAAFSPWWTRRQFFARIASALALSLVVACSSVTPTDSKGKPAPTVVDFDVPNGQVYWRFLAHPGLGETTEISIVVDEPRSSAQWVATATVCPIDPAQEQHFCVRLTVMEDDRTIVVTAENPADPGSARVLAADQRFEVGRSVSIDIRQFRNRFIASIRGQPLWQQDTAFDIAGLRLACSSAHCVARVR